MFAANLHQGRSMNPLFHRRRRSATAALAGLVMAVSAIAPATAQTANPPQGVSPAPTTVTPPANTLAVPGFWDPRRRPERPDLSRIVGIRFLTETDYPPFHYAGADGAPAG